MHGPAVYVCGGGGWGGGGGKGGFILYLQKIVWIFTYDISWLYFT